MIKYTQAYLRETRIVTEKEWKEICKQRETEWKALPLKIRVIQNLKHLFMTLLVLLWLGSPIIYLVLKILGKTN